MYTLYSSYTQIDGVDAASLPYHPAAWGHSLLSQMIVRLLHDAVSTVHAAPFQPGRTPRCAGRREGGPPSATGDVEEDEPAWWPARAAAS